MRDISILEARVSHTSFTLKSLKRYFRFYWYIYQKGSKKVGQYFHTWSNSISNLIVGCIKTEECNKTIFISNNNYYGNSRISKNLYDTDIEYNCWILLKMTRNKRRSKFKLRNIYCRLIFRCTASLTDRTERNFTHEIH